MEMMFESPERTLASHQDVTSPLRLRWSRAEYTEGQDDDDVYGREQREPRCDTNAESRRQVGRDEKRVGFIEHTAIENRELLE